MDEGFIFGNFVNVATLALGSSPTQGLAKV
jgi:hypothetical protein